MLTPNYTAHFEYRDGLCPKQKSKFLVSTLKTHFLRVDYLVGIYLQLGIRFLEVPLITSQNLLLCIHRNARILKSQNNRQQPLLTAVISIFNSIYLIFSQVKVSPS